MNSLIFKKIVMPEIRFIAGSGQFSYRNDEWSYFADSLIPAEPYRQCTFFVAASQSLSSHFYLEINASSS